MLRDSFCDFLGVTEMASVFVPFPGRSRPRLFRPTHIHMTRSQGQRISVRLVIQYVDCLLPPKNWGVPPKGSLDQKDWGTWSGRKSGNISRSPRNPRILFLLGDTIPESSSIFSHLFKIPWRIWSDQVCLPMHWNFPQKAEIVDEVSLATSKIIKNHRQNPKITQNDPK